MTLVIFPNMIQDIHVVTPKKTVDQHVAFLKNSRPEALPSAAIVEAFLVRPLGYIPKAFLYDLRVDRTELC